MRKDNNKADATSRWKNITCAKQKGERRKINSVSNAWKKIYGYGNRFVDIFLEKNVWY